MNRRKAIKLISLGTTGALAAGGGYAWWSMSKRADLSWLESNKGLLTAITETIIPTTDSPGAKEAGVADFIIKMVRSCTPRKEQNAFVDGMKDLASRSRHTYGHPYEQCSEEEKSEVLSYFEAQAKPMKGIAGKASLRYLGRPFFSILRDYTAEGYCTSEPGATKGLAYQYIPGAYQPCIPLQPGQKAWATN